jgi:hypothetical protein
VSLALSEETIRKAFAETGSLYGNVMDEIRQRLALVEKVTDDGFDELPEFAITDLCCLQFRKVCEGVALGCLTAHSYIPGAKHPKLRTMWNADTLMKRLERLHTDFFIKPCTVGRSPNGQVTVTSRQVAKPPKPRLARVYTGMDEYLHVGSAAKRSVAGIVLARESIQQILDFFRELLFDHFITLSDPLYRIVVEMNDAAGKVTAHLQRSDGSPATIASFYPKPNIKIRLPKL